MGPNLVGHLLYEKEADGLLWIKFNLPQFRNALWGRSQINGTVAKVGEYMRAGDDDPDVRVMVLTGVGDDFCAGANMRFQPTTEEAGPIVPGAAQSLLGGADADRQYFYHAFSKLHQDIAQIRKPTIAMINGVAAGSGMDMALHCDIRIGCERTRFIGYQQVGQILENGGCYYLPRLVGLGRALEFAYLGVLEAERSLRWGLLNHLVPSSDLERFTRGFCAQLIDVPPMVQWSMKRIMRSSLDSSFDATMVMTSNIAGSLNSSADALEAKQAFREKRKPRFRGM